MGFLIEAFEFIINTINTIWEFLIGFFENFFVALSLISGVFTFCMNFLSDMPQIFYMFGFTTVFISVLFFILNRESGN